MCGRQLLSFVRWVAGLNYSEGIHGWLSLTLGKMRTFYSILVLVGCWKLALVQGECAEGRIEANEPKEGGKLMVVKLNDTLSAGVILPKRCRVSKTITVNKTQYLLVLRDRAGWGSDFEMMLSVASHEEGGQLMPVTRILVTEKDLRVKGSVRWLEDFRLNAGKIEVLLAQYSSEKLPADVNRSWIGLSEFE